MLTQFEVVIPSTTQTGYLDLREWVLVGVRVPDTWTSANIDFECATRKSFKASSDVAPHNNDWVSVVDADGTQIEIVTAQGTFVNISPNAFQANEFLRLVSDSAQGASRTVIVTATRRAGV
jgi:hypothetical protein